MATVEDVASLALSAIDIQADAPVGIEQVGRWVAERYKELVGKTRFRHKRRLGSITMPDAITTGTATVVTSSTSVQLNADAMAAIASAGIGTTIQDGNWYIRLPSGASNALAAGAGVWYQVTAYNSGTGVLTIANPYTQNDISGGSFILLPRYYTLASDARWLGKFVYPAKRRTLGMRSYMDYDRIAPDRILSSTGPYFVAEASNTTARASNPVVVGGLKRVELYPYTLTTCTIYYVYWSLPILATDPVELLDTELPQEIDPYVLREGVLIDMYRYRASQAANKGDVDAAGYWRNESRAQMTSWQTQIADAARADRGQDDVSLIYHFLGLGGLGGYNGGEIYDGYSQWVQVGWPNLTGGGSS